MEKQYISNNTFYAINTKTKRALRGSLKGSYKAGNHIAAYNAAGFRWPLTTSTIIKKVPDLKEYEVVDFDDLKTEADKAEFETRFYALELFYGGRYAALI